MANSSAAIRPMQKRQTQLANSTRVPPHNLQAEESLIGAMLLSRDAIGPAVETCSSDDFYKPAHAHIFEAIVSLWSRGEPADPVTVADELQRADLLESIGGQGILLTLQMNTPATSNAARYAKIIEEHALLRKLITTASEIAEIGYNTPEDVAGAVDQAEAMMFDITQKRSTDNMSSIRELLSKNLDRLEALYDNNESITGVPTGFIDLDEKLSGLQPNALIILGARPAAGKTSLALNMVSHAAMNGTPVLFFSLEMGEEEVSLRLLSAEARVDASRLKNGRLHETDWPKVQQAIKKLAEAPIIVNDNPNCTVMDIRAKARRMKTSPMGLGLVVVDYLQLMTGRRNAESRQIEVAEMSRGLKLLARELQVPVVALSQLSRGLEARTNKRPMLSDLKESGGLEADADVVLFIYRDEVYYQDSPDRGTAEVIVAKHRNGPVGTTQLAFIDRYTKFANMARV